MKSKEESSKKIPTYVPIYNKLYSDIINGIYSDGDLLPSESTLTKEYGVSRHTLRQALTVLSEDGLIQKKQGKGTIITKSKKTNETKNCEFVNPLIEYARGDIEKILWATCKGDTLNDLQSDIKLLAQVPFLTSNNHFGIVSVNLSLTFRYDKEFKYGDVNKSLAETCLYINQNANKKTR